MAKIRTENDRSSPISSFLDLRINHLSTVTSSQEIQLEDARVLREDSVTSQAQGLRRFLTPGFPGTLSKRCAPVFSIEKKGHCVQVDVSRYGLFMGDCWISEATYREGKVQKELKLCLFLKIQFFCE